jgi:uncharacterized membrane protein YccF (DUF307 family)
MRLVLNVLWLVLSGFWMFLARIGLFVLWPFGRTVLKKPGAGGFKLIPISLFPLGKDIVSTGSAQRAIANGALVGPTV